MKKLIFFIVQPQVYVILTAFYKLLFVILVFKQKNKPNKKTNVDENLKKKQYQNIKRYHKIETQLAFYTLANFQFAKFYFL